MFVTGEQQVMCQPAVARHVIHATRVVRAVPVGMMPVIPIVVGTNYWTLDKKT